MTGEINSPCFAGLFSHLIARDAGRAFMIFFLAVFRPLLLKAYLNLSFPSYTGFSARFNAGFNSMPG
jgi:hypothetical protein